MGEDRDDNRLTGPLDAAVHFLDRQLVAVDDRLAGKVDDLELAESADGRLAVTALLIGAPALVPRLGGGWLTERWVQLGRLHADRTTPGRVPLDKVESLTSAVNLTVHREGILDRKAGSDDDRHRHRLDDLIGMAVEDAGPRAGLRVLDVRLAAMSDPPSHELLVTHLVVGGGGLGSLLGYDRDAEQGPWLVAAVLRLWHRHSGLVAWENVRSVDWEGGRVRVDGTPPAPLTHARLHPADS